MKIVFMGSPDFALPSLQRIIDSNHELLAVVSGEDKRRGRAKPPTPTPVKALALEQSIPVITTSSTHDPDFIESLTKLNADLFVVVAFKVLPPSVLELPRIGSINVHASLLPKYRGAAPIHWAIAEGEEETGCTIFFLDTKVDTGAILCGHKTPIRPTETTGDLYHRLKHVGAEALIEALSIIESGDYHLQSQDNRLASPAPKVFKQDGLLDFNQPLRTLYNRYRAMTPVPGAWVSLHGVAIKIHSVSVPSEEISMELLYKYPISSREPGQLITEHGQLYCACLDGFIRVNAFQFPSKNKVKTSDYLRSNQLDGVLNV
jgi:methionyl-tRNA formyltransferase